MTDSAPKELWGTGHAYEQYVGRWSRQVAGPFLAWLAAPAGAAWLDVGCGTGALVSTILDRARPASVLGIDRAEGFVQAARAQVTDPRAQFLVGDATQLPTDARHDVTVSGLVLNFVPDHAAMLREMVRVTRPGGTVAAYVWDYAGGMQMMRHFWDVALELSPDDAQVDEADRFPICAPDALAALWEAGGLTGTVTTAIEIPTVFRDFDDYWQPFMGRQGAAPAYLATLDADVQAQIRERLHTRLARTGDGRIPLTARAWAVQGQVP